MATVKVSVVRDVIELTTSQLEQLMSLVDNEVSYVEGSFANGEMTDADYELESAKLDNLRVALGGNSTTWAPAT
jgi:hypothetical protein